MIAGKACLWLWIHSSVGLSDLWNARLAYVGAWQVLALQVKALQGSFYFEFPIFPRYQKILSLQKQWEALRRMKAWVRMQPHHVLLSEMCSHWKTLKDVWITEGRRRVRMTFFFYSGDNMELWDENCSLLYALHFPVWFF